MRVYGTFSCHVLGGPGHSRPCSNTLAETEKIQKNKSAVIHLMAPIEALHDDTYTVSPSESRADKDSIMN